MTFTSSQKQNAARRHLARQSRALRRARSRALSRARPKDRRGVLILIVLGLLVIFLMIGVTFVVVTSQQSQAARSASRAPQAGGGGGVDPEVLLDDAMHQLLRDTNDERSTMRGHSLLRDMYGSATLHGTVITKKPATRKLAKGQLVMFDATLGEGFFDDDGNGRYTPPEFYIDVDRSGNWTEDPLPSEPLQDLNGNAIWDAGDTFGDLDEDGIYDAVSITLGYYKGQLLTFTSGDFLGSSVRIVDYEFLNITPGNPAVVHLLLMIPESADGSTSLPAKEDTFVINSRPFNGTGFGYNPTNGTLDVNVATGSFFPRLAPSALLPNQMQSLSQETENYLRGGEDESYDAADYQNLFLALVPENPEENADTYPNEMVIPSFHRPALVNYWHAQIPTSMANFKGPDQIFGTPDDIRIRPSVFLRPDPQDQRYTDENGNGVWDPREPFVDLDQDGEWTPDPPEPFVDLNQNGVWDKGDPDFTGKAFGPIHGPWDVDNDGDGVPDSVWLDLGSPVVSDSEGRQFKPLFAILCTDLDGRLNLNAHGSVEHLMPPPPFMFLAGPANGTGVDLVPGSPGDDDGINGPDDPGELGWPGSDDNISWAIPRGQGYGPAEISLAPLFDYDPTEFERLLFGHKDKDDTFNYTGRYGWDGGSTPRLPGKPRKVDPLAFVKFFEYPNWNVPWEPGQDGEWGQAGLDDDGKNGIDDIGERGLWDDVRTPTSFGSPPDLKGRYAFGLDSRGTPIYEGLLEDLPQTLWGLRTNSPYELDLSLGGPRGILEESPGDDGIPGTPDDLFPPDTPYSAAELERLLRPFDADAGELPNRLWEVVDAFQTGANPEGNRRIVTTESYDLPVPNTLATRDIIFGPDGQPGKADTDDDFNGTKDDFSETGWPLSDDYLAVTGLPPTNLHITDLLRYRLMVEQNLFAPLLPKQEQAINTQITMMLSPELIRGERMDVNRPFGNGRDDNGNLVVDESEEARAPANGLDDDRDGFVDEAGEGLPANYNGFDDDFDFEVPPVDEPDEVQPEKMWNALAGVRGTPLNNIDFYHDNFRLLRPSNMLARQLYARHLYVLGMLLSNASVEEGDGGYMHPVDPNGPLVVETGDSAVVIADKHESQRELTARRIAQWAVNVVDFRDADAIMTPFEYDPNPFDGWYRDGFIRTGDWDPGADGEWGIAGVDDNFDFIVDNFSEAGWSGSDDVFSWKNGPDGEWGIAGFDDDGDLFVDNISEAGWPGSDDLTDRYVVWGCERPELLITETLAFHDRRVKDTDFDDGDQKLVSGDDTDFDQPRIPQGSAFFELYCTGNPNSLTPPNELYSLDGRLDLGRMAPERPLTGDRYPVWRLAISESHNNVPNQPNSFIARSISDFDTLTFQPENLDLSHDPTPTNPTPKLPIERFVWLAPHNPPNDIDGDRTYYGRTGKMDPEIETTLQRTSTVLLSRGRYAVVGPRDRTKIGTTTTLGTHSSHEIRLDSVSATDNNGGAIYTYPSTSGVNGDILPALGIVAAARPPAPPAVAWTKTAQTAPTGIGISVSEPLPNDATVPYYPEPDETSDGIWDAYGDILETDPTKWFLDEPLDSKDLVAPFKPRPLKADGLLGTGTTINYRTVVLQRLANPLLPWNPLPSDADHDQDAPVNPYRTVDWMPIDLTVFNGENVPTNDDPDDPSPDMTPNKVLFESRQRGKVANGEDVNLWSNWDLEDQEGNFEKPNDTDPDAALTTLNFRHNLVHSLGYLNDTYGPPVASPLPGIFPQLWTMTDGAPAQYRGSPKTPFPWLTWNNRPYVSQLELMQVPSASAGRLLSEFAMIPDSKPPNPYEVDDPSTPIGAPTKPKEKFERVRAPFGHLFNFFQSSVNANDSAKFYRLLDYTHVPSRFVGTETVLNPSVFDDPIMDGTETLHPPFHKISNFREPGRVNINTIVGGRYKRDSAPLVVWRSRVWEGIRHYTDENDNAFEDGFDTNDHPGPPWQDPAGIITGLVDSRRGYGAIGDGILSFNPNVPTFFANPFRSAAAGRLVPLPSLERLGVDCTLLRGDVSSGPDGVWGTPNFDDDGNGIVDDISEAEQGLHDDTLSTAALLNTRPDGTDRDYNDTDRNPYFRYQGMQRLTNLVTTRSNVYAVWITVGFFEVKPQLVDDAHPDGFRLFQELGTDTGQIERHRGFYIIDRSIPVAFEPGVNHNVDNAVILRRFIE